MSRSKERAREVIEMNKTISWITYIWLLTVEAAEDLLESVRRLLFERNNPSTESRNPYLNDRFRILPPTAVH
jgi:hypothetical protein